MCKYTKYWGYVYKATVFFFYDNKIYIPKISNQWILFKETEASLENVEMFGELREIIEEE